MRGFLANFEKVPRVLIKRFTDLRYINHFMIPPACETPSKVRYLLLKLRVFAICADVELTILRFFELFVYL